MSDKAMIWAGRASTALATVPFLMGGFMMLSGNPQAVEGLTKYGWPAGSLTTIVTLELGSLAAYLCPPTAPLGALLLTGYLGGAVATHLRAGESPAMAVIVGVLVWGGLWLREPRLRALLPLRRGA